MKNISLNGKTILNINFIIIINIIITVIIVIAITIKNSIIIIIITIISSSSNLHNYFHYICLFYFSFLFSSGDVCCMDCLEVELLFFALLFQGNLPRFGSAIWELPFDLSWFQKLYNLANFMYNKLIKKPPS